jgi:hypothetical protein
MGASIVLVNKEQFNLSLEKLKQAGGRKRDVAAIFRTATKPLVKSAKSNVSARKTGEIKSYLPSRVHPKGTLKKSIKFAVSKKYKLVYWVAPMTKSGADTYYVRMFAGGRKDFVVSKPAFINDRWVAKGTKIRGYAGTDFMGKAISATEAVVFNSIEKGMSDLLQKLFLS